MNEANQLSFFTVVPNSEFSPGPAARLEPQGDYGEMEIALGAGSASGVCSLSFTSSTESHLSVPALYLSLCVRRCLSSGAEEA